jgi:hypothetical protein
MKKIKLTSYFSFCILLSLIFLSSLIVLLSTDSYPNTILATEIQENSNALSDIILSDDGTFTKPHYMGVKMYMPRDGTWKIAADCAGNVTLYHHPNPSSETTDADLTIMGPFKGEGGPVRIWGQIISNDDGRTYADYHLIEAKDTTLHDNPAHIIVYTAQNTNGILSQNMKVIVERGEDTSKAWLIQYFTDSIDVYNNLLPTVNNMINSFELISSGQFGDNVCFEHGQNG